MQLCAFGRSAFALGPLPPLGPFWVARALFLLAFFWPWCWVGLEVGFGPFGLAGVVLGAGRAPGAEGFPAPPWDNRIRGDRKHRLAHTPVMAPVLRNSPRFAPVSSPPCLLFGSRHQPQALPSCRLPSSRFSGSRIHARVQASCFLTFLVGIPCTKPRRMVN